MEAKQSNINLIAEKIEKNEKFLENYLSNESYKNLILESFKSSKIAKNGLSLISKDEENNLKKETNTEIIDFFKMSALLLQKENEENFQCEENNLFIKNYLEKFLPEKKSLSKFFIFLNFFFRKFFD